MPLNCEINPATGKIEFIDNAGVLYRYRNGYELTVNDLGFEGISLILEDPRGNEDPAGIELPAGQVEILHEKISKCLGRPLSMSNIPGGVTGALWRVVLRKEPQRGDYIKIRYLIQILRKIKS